MTSIRVIVADDHPVFREGIRTYLGGSNRIEIIAEARTGQEALVLTKTTAPDILLLDVNLPDCDGMEIAESLQRSGSPVRIIVISAYDDIDYVRRFMAAGVAGYLLKDEAATFLIETVEAVARGETGLFSERIQMQLSQMKLLAEHLSNREMEVLSHLTTGKTNYAIAQALDISEKTVEKHLDAIYRKLGVRSRAEAAVTAVRGNLLSNLG